MAGQTVECVACGHVGSTKTKGSFLITLILLCFGFLPGVVYEVWRRAGGKVCSACGSGNVKLFIPTQRVVTQKQPSPMIVRDSFQNNPDHLSKIEGNVEVKSCPFCAESIRMTAIKCKHCGSMLDE